MHLVEHFIIDLLADSDALVEALCDADVLADSDALLSYTLVMPLVFQWILDALVEALCDADVLGDSDALVDADTFCRIPMHSLRHFVMRQFQTRLHCLEVPPIHFVLVDSDLYTVSDTVSFFVYMLLVGIEIDLFDSYRTFCNRLLQHHRY